MGRSILLVRWSMATAATLSGSGTLCFGRLGWCLPGILQVGAPAVHARVHVRVEARGTGDEVVDRRPGGTVSEAGLLRALGPVLVHVADLEMRRRCRRHQQ